MENKKNQITPRLNLHLPSFLDLTQKIDSYRENSLTNTPIQNRNAFRFFDKRKGSLNQNTRTKIDSNHMNNQLNFPQESRNIIYYEPQKISKKPSQISLQIRTIQEQINKCQQSIDSEYQLTTKNVYKQYDFMTNPFANNSVQNESQYLNEQLKQEVMKIPQGTTSLPSLNPYIEIGKLESIYRHEIEKAFFRKNNISLFSKVKKKIPRLKITKDNKIQKQGEPQSLVEHNFRVLTHEGTPCVPQPILPTFQKRKDIVSEYILEYLKSNQSESKVEKLPMYIRNLVQKHEPGLGENQKKQNILKTAEAI